MRFPPPPSRTWQLYSVQCIGVFNTRILDLTFSEAPEGGLRSALQTRTLLTCKAPLHLANLFLSVFFVQNSRAASARLGRKAQTSVSGAGLSLSGFQHQVPAHLVSFSYCNGWAYPLSKLKRRLDF